MRMHEILGVEPGEVFGYKNACGDEVKYNLDAQGNMYRADEDHKRVPSPREIVAIINHPERIIRKPRLTWEQFIILKAVKMLGCNWFTKDDDGRIEGWEIKPRKTTGAWVEGVGDTLKSCFVNLAGAKAMKIEQIITYDEPLDIVQTLKDAEVEG